MVERDEKPSVRATASDGVGVGVGRARRRDPSPVRLQKQAGHLRKLLSHRRPLRAKLLGSVLIWMVERQRLAECSNHRRGHGGSAAHLGDLGAASLWLLLMVLGAQVVLWRWSHHEH